MRELLFKKGAMKCMRDVPESHHLQLQISERSRTRSRSRPKKFILCPLHHKPANCTHTSHAEMQVVSLNWEESTHPEPCKQYL